MTLWVFRRNAQGRAFYARSGFRLDDTLSKHEPTGVADGPDAAAPRMSTQ